MISLLHATKRFDAARKCQQMWLDRAANRSQVEIITAVDSVDYPTCGWFTHLAVSNGNTPVEAWNAAAKFSTGDILVVLDDDWEPPHGWDEIIVSRLGAGDILKVGDKHRKDGLICHPILTRRLYEKIGYVFHPLFKSVYCDDWFTSQAKALGFVDASDVEFLHANPSQGYGVEDEIARTSNSAERYAHGKQTFDRLTTDNVVIGFTCSDRPHYLKESLESWKNTNLSLVTSIHFFIEPTDNRDECVAVIDDFARAVPVSVIKHFNAQKMGVLRNPWELFENLFTHQLATFVILAEDDFVVSRDILDFFKLTMSHRWKWENECLAICAKWDGEGANTDPAGAQLVDSFSGNTWGTWPDQWKRYLRDTWDFDYSTADENGAGGGWDWNISLRVMPRNYLQCAVPTASRSKHIGVTGVHCTPEVFADTVVKNFIP